MARKPRKEGAQRKKRGKASASGRRGAPKHLQERARRSAAKVAKSAKGNRTSLGNAATLKRELNEARARQAATAEILKIIASSPADVKPVFEAIVRTIVRVLRCDRAFFLRCMGNTYYSEATAARDGSFSVPGRSSPVDPAANFPSRAMVSKKTVYYPDRSLIELPAYERMVSEKYGVDSSLFLPLLRQDQCIGVLAMASKSRNAFSASDIALAESFRDQALIAIENARLFHETKEALERQTASAEVLQVISSSPGDLKPVFDQILAKAMRLCEAQCGFIYQGEQGAMRAVAEIGVPRAFAEYRRQHLHTGGAATPIDAMRATRKPAHVHDARDSEPYRSGNPNAVAGVDLGGARTVLYVPMIRNDDIVGVINLYRQEVKPFTDEQIALLENFASQAVIAIENARLFNETKEALARQTATSDVLKVIASSPSNLQPVFDAIAERSKELVAGHSTTVFRFAGDMAELVAATPVSKEADAVLRATFPMPLSNMRSIEQILRGEVAVMVDAGADTEPESSRAVALARGFRSRLAVPLRGDGGPIGFISITRKEPGAFADKDVELVRTFADQAVIAIKNVELFEQVEAKTRDLEESLQQQTATADVLKVISRSAFDLQTVLDTLVGSAYRLCGAGLGLLYLRDKEAFECKATAGFGVEAANELFKGRPIRAGRGTAAERVIMTGEVQAVTDFFADPDFDPVVRERIRNDLSSDISQLRSTLAVPMTRENEVVGVLAIARTQTGPFPQRQVELLQTFADQAVIAIENLRLFNETTQALEQQTATADILKVIASSPDDVQPVFQAIADRSNRLVNGFATTVVSIADETVHLSAFTPTNPVADAALKSFYPQPLSTFTYSEDIRRGRIHRVVDAEVEVADQPAALEMIRRRGWRSALWVPLLREGKAIGVIGATRVAPGPFADHHVQLLQTFADQAVIAISNVELFQQVQQRTRELSQSLDDLRAAQDRLVQTEKLASLGQLTAGIAHEIKNPLNFVNNFSALSVELTDELNDVLRQAALAEKIRREVDELTQLLKSNLEKVVQHGKRADSIVKNMLLHSREGSGEQRAADINALVEESLNLAYHGARAETSGFNITLQRQFDAGAGSAELFPQEMTRALLNLISNGFYAATRRKVENGDGAFEPTLLASTKDLGGSVEIRIRDNGTGIPPEVKEKMFNPFFTTKPAGEGTGLGLSMTHDIIVKQHGGTIDVTTEPGSFTEFVLVLPRANNGHGKSRGHA